MKDVVKELNTFLKGQYMGIHSYEQCIQQEPDPQIKDVLQKIQQDHKKNAMKVAERIQDLGGSPVTDEGIIGSIQNYLGNLTIPRDTKTILKKAIKGEDYYAMEVSKNYLVGDLDEESKQLIDTILENEQKHVDRLDSLLHSKI